MEGGREEETCLGGGRCAAGGMRLEEEEDLLLSRQSTKREKGIKIQTALLTNLRNRPAVTFSNESVARGE